MPDYGEYISDFLAGNALEIRRNIGSIEPGALATQASLVVKENTSDTDANSVINSIITQVASSSGVITDIAIDDYVSTLSFTISGNSSQSSVTIEPSGTNNKVNFKSVTASQLSNNLSIQYLNPGQINQPLVVTQNGNAIVFSLATDGTGAITTTANDISAYVLGDATLSEVITTSIVGLGTGVVAAVSQTYLTGGNGGTGSLTPGRTYYYKITATSSTGNTYTLETGTLVASDPNDTRRNTAVSTKANAAKFSSERMNTIINEYVDVLLHDFRQLTVWDEHARRDGNDPTLLRLTYGNWNKDYQIGIYNSQNNRIPAMSAYIDPVEGTVRIDNDSGYDDYFITYQFDMFPPKDLEILVRLKLQELNVLGAAEGGYLTNYRNIDEAPGYWDGPLALGVVAEAFKRLQSDGSLWKNYLIWQNGAEGQRIAGDMAAQYFNMYLDMSKSLKKQHLIAKPTSTFDLFQSVGFGFYSAGGSKFRGLQINRLTIY